MTAIFLNPDRTVKVENRDKPVTFRERSIGTIEECLLWARDSKKSLSSCNVETGRNKWTGTTNVDEYINMLRYGWETGVKLAHELDGMTSDASEQLTFVPSVAGVFPIVPAYLAGNPVNMYAPVIQETENRRGVTLVIDASYNSSTAAKTALEYAQEIMKLVIWFQQQRIDVAVYATVAALMYGKRVVYLVPVRHCGDVLQVERIAAVLHPSFLRRGFFALVEYEYHLDKGVTYPECATCNSGYGKSTHCTADEMRIALNDAQSIVMLPKVGTTSATSAVESALNIKIRSN